MRAAGRTRSSTLAPPRERSPRRRARRSRAPERPDEDRVDRHRADRRIRRLLAGRHLVQRQQLQHAQPAAASQAVSGPTSPISPMPQLVVDGHENSGMSRPARRRPTGRVMRGRRSIELPQHAPMPSANAGSGSEQAHDQVPLAGKVEEITRMDQHAIASANRAPGPLRP